MIIKHSTIFRNLIVLFFILKPFYLWGSGGLQIADFIIILLGICSFFLGGFITKEGMDRNKTPIILSLVFLMYVVSVNGIWTIVLSTSTEVFFTSFFYAFNTLTLISTIFVYNKLKTDIFKYIYFGIVISIVIQVIIYLVMKDLNPGRASNFFNNPNQLGYYALLCLSFLFIIERKIKYRPLVFLSVVFGCFFLILVSVSKAAIVSSVLMYIVFAFVSKKKGKFKAINLTFSVIISFLLYSVFTHKYYLYGRYNILDSILIRINQSDTGRGYLAGRGYDRILNHENFIIFGAGEGEHQRFINAINPLELHSTLGTVLFSYGIIGLFLFLSIMFYIFLKNKFINFYPIIFVFIYGLTHNGLRNSILWMLIAALIVYREAPVPVMDKNKKEVVHG